MADGIAGIARAIAYWLNYKNLTGLAGLFSEASLTVPIAEFLSTKNAYDLNPEVRHPNFSNNSGRPRQIDFVATNKRLRWLFALETKYFPSAVQRVMDDIGRLLKLSANCDKYIVIAGPAGSDVASCFRINMKIGGRHQNVMARFFPTKRRESKVIKLRSQHSKIKRLFYNFMVDYRINKMPNAFEIRCVDFYRSKLFAVGVWKISLRSGTGQISRGQLRSLVRK